MHLSNAFAKELEMMEGILSVALGSLLVSLYRNTKHQAGIPQSKAEKIAHSADYFGECQSETQVVLA